MLSTILLCVVLGMSASADSKTQPPVESGMSGLLVVSVGWENLQANWPRTTKFTSSTVTERSAGRRSCVIAGQDADGPIQAIVVERAGFLAATFVDGSGNRWGARGAVGQPLQFELLAPEAMRDCAGAVAASPEILAQGEPPIQAQGGLAGGCADTGTVDVLVITTPGARQQAGGAGQLAALVDLAEASANSAYANSAILPRIRVIFDMEVSYTEVNFGSDLSAMASASDGVLDEIHQLRDAAGADLVAMIRTSGEYCGIAYLMPANDPSVAGMGFSVTAWSCLSSQTFAHELGHNMGCCHAPNDGGGCTTGGVFPYSVGHRFNGTNGTMYRTVMAYSPGARIDHFSNPLVNYNGTATGVAPSGSDAGRDNAGSIAITNAAIRGFRCAAPPGSFGDCDQDGRIDIVQLADGSASDCDSNGVLDRCDLLSTNLCADSSRFLCDSGVVLGLPSAVIVADNYYGYAVDTDGRTAVVGAYGDDIGGSFAGSANVFTISGSSTQLIATLRHVGPMALDVFGRAVAVDGNFIAIAAEMRDVQGLNAAGDVSVFMKSETGAPWQLNATLNAPVPTIAGRFGAAVALRGDVLVVGSPETIVDQGPIQHGRAYIYERISGAWVLVKTLDPLDNTNQGNFGSSVAVADGVVVIGAPYVTNTAGIETGAVYVSRRTAAGWAAASRLTGVPIIANRAGTSVAMSDGRMIIGAPGSGSQVGSTVSAVHVFELNGSQWQFVQSIASTSQVNASKFGSRVAVDGDGLLVGSWKSTESSGTHEYFARGVSGWEPRGVVRTGFAVAIRGEYAAVGVYREIRSGVPVGDARIELRLKDDDGDNKADRCERAHGDLDLNGFVDGLDMAFLLAAWGSPSQVADIDSNGIVDGSDLAILLAAWGAL